MLPFAFPRPRLIALTAAALALPLASHAQTLAETIYSGGPILTMEEGAMRAEAVAVADGRILAVGSAAEIEALASDATERFDLAGRTLLPGFVDSHGHVVMGGLQALSANLLSEPDGTVNDIPALQEELRRWAAENGAFIAAYDAIIGFGYDQSRLAELRPPTREELDAVSTEVPVYIIHQSGHFGVANSLGLERAGITAESENPPGGIIRKRSDTGAPTGVLEENAHFAALGALLAKVDAEGFIGFAEAGSRMWARYGYTTAQEGRAAPAFIQIAQEAARRGLLLNDVVLYPDVLLDRDAILQSASRDYENNLRVGGAKLTIDGSPQGFTAFRDRPYYDPIGDYPPGWAGYSAVTMEQVIDSIDWAFANGVQILTHANGERASDMLLSAIANAEAEHGPADRRTVLIHGQFLREDQVDRIKALNVFPSLFPMHTFYWGDWHRDFTVGPARADDISPTGWLRERDMIFGSHHDAPVALPDSMRILDATVTRRSRSGDIIGPTQRVDVLTALKAMTIWPAYQHFEEDSKGSIAPGKRADFVVLSQDPTAVDPETLDGIRVEATIKDGAVIYAAP
ncbi:N-substituted formamide deformylase precursor [Pseudoruegeria aquimaris]|uniref:N-substituted formamide deformylase n=1 Tax=Pseudoruegeria aquimaris TaxID=393663 RepID=A0A1Y5RML4_9RHOB|nr:amidohydrolase [Pseudoruegeria aquimaris]SLN18477.1 N-substituted formamide deformylase precursor [Pseudoruegeria aquimaris]